MCATKTSRSVVLFIPKLALVGLPSSDRDNNYTLTIPASASGSDVQFSNVPFSIVHGLFSECLVVGLNVSVSPKYGYIGDKKVIVCVKVADDDKQAAALPRLGLFSRLTD